MGARIIRAQTLLKSQTGERPILYLIFALISFASPHSKKIRQQKTRDEKIQQPYISSNSEITSMLLRFNTIVFDVSVFRKISFVHIFLEFVVYRSEYVCVCVHLVSVIRFNFTGE